MNRRHWLCCSAALGDGLFTALSAQAQGWRNPCRATLPRALAQHPLVQQAFGAAAGRDIRHAPLVARRAAARHDLKTPRRSSS